MPRAQAIALKQDWVRVGDKLDTWLIPSGSSIRRRAIRFSPGATGTAVSPATWATVRASNSPSTSRAGRPGVRAPAFVHNRLYSTRGYIEANISAAAPDPAPRAADVTIRREPWRAVA